MSRARDTVMGYGLELGSRVLHSPLIVPDGVYRRIVQRLLHLDQSNDLPLLWRVAQDVSPDERWVEAEPVDPRPTSLADPQHAVVGVPTEALIDAMGRRDAMAGTGGLRLHTGWVRLLWSAPMRRGDLAYSCGLSMRLASRTNWE